MEAAHQLLRLPLGDYPPRTEHLRVCDGAADIVGREPNVEGDGGVEALEGFGRRAPEPSSPQRAVVSLAHGTQFRRPGGKVFFAYQGASGSALGPLGPVGTREEGADVVSYVR